MAPQTMNPAANAGRDQLPLAALEVVANCVVITDAAGTILWVNPAFTRMTGYTLDEVLGRTPRILKSGAHPPGLYRDLWATVTAGLVWSGEMMNRRKDGSTYFEEQTITPVRDGDGTVARFIAIKQDITARRRVEEALRQRELQWRALIAAAPVAIVGLEAAGRVTTWNRAATELFGWSEEEARHGPDVLDAALGDVPGYRALLAGAASGAAVRDVPVRGRKRDGTPIDLSVSIASLGASEGYPGYIVLASDVTERNQMESSLRESEQRYRVLAENVTDVISVLDLDLRVTYVSPSVTQLRGYTPAEVMAQTPEQRLMPRSLEMVRRLLAEELARAQAVPASNPRAGMLELEIPCKDGHTVWAEAQVTVLRDGGGPPCGFISVARDITARRRIEAEKDHVHEQLRQAQKMEAIGRLAGGIAHDFNNLLTVIMGRSHIASRRLPPGDPIRQDVEAIEKTSQRAAALTRQLLAFSRQQVLQPRVLDVNAIVTGVEALLRRVIGEDVELVTVLAPDAGALRADPSQLEQVLLNLAVNARDAMPLGGRLTIETDNVEVTPDVLRAHIGAEPGPYVRLTVSDTGHGMDEVTRGRIFEPFFTTKAPGKGTGLGLATVHGIVKQTGGHIAVESDAGRGTTFRIYLPRTPGGSAEPASTPPVAMPRGTETILLVEDDSQVRALAREILEASGYGVIEASPGEAADLASTGRPIHALVTDVVMPEMNGVELARRIRRTRPAIRVLYVSGYTDSRVAEQVALEPDFVLLHKPFTVTTLTAKLREVLDAPARRPSAIKRQRPRRAPMPSSPSPTRRSR